MIIYKNKGYEIRQDKPNENWTKKDCFIVEDSSELANKIIKAYPYYNFITDENDNLIDIEILEKPILPYEPTENEMIMLAIAELDMQREIDKTETQLAIAELAETILGGI